jgi:hypothetical protein
MLAIVLSDIPVARDALHPLAGTAGISATAGTNAVLVWPPEYEAIVVDAMLIIPPCTEPDGKLTALSPNLVALVEDPEIAVIVTV